MNRKLADALHQRDRAWRDVNLPDGTDAAADIDDAVRCLRQEVVRLLQQADCVIEQGQLEEKAHEQVDEARELHRQFSECHGRGVCRATAPSTWRLRIGTDIATVTLVIALTVVDEVDVATGCFVLLLALLAFFVIAIWHRAAYDANSRRRDTQFPVNGVIVRDPLEEARVELEGAEIERRAADYQLKRFQRENLGQQAVQDAADRLARSVETVTSCKAALAERSQAVDRIVEKMSALAPHFPELWRCDRLGPPRREVGCLRPPGAPVRPV